MPNFVQQPEDSILGLTPVSGLLNRCGGGFFLLSLPIRSESLKRFGHLPDHRKVGGFLFISLTRSFAFGLGLTEALHVGPYQRDLELRPARFRVGVSLPPCGFFLF